MFEFWTQLLKTMLPFPPVVHLVNFTASKSALKLPIYSCIGKMSTQSVTGQYLSILDDISQCLTILGNIWQSWALFDNIIFYKKIGNIVHS